MTPKVSSSWAALQILDKKSGKFWMKWKFHSKFTPSLLIARLLKRKFAKSAKATVSK